MSNKALLTVALVFQNQRDVVESTLTSLFELSTIPFELFVIDDASSDGSNEVIQSLLEYYRHEQTFYFQHQQVTGRSNSLSEVLLQSSGQLLWAPENIQDINEQKLSASLGQLMKSDAQALAQQQGLPNSCQEWLNFINQQNWPGDGAFIWNLSAIPHQEHFFNPYIKNYQCLELAVRLGEDKIYQNEDLWHIPSRLSGPPAPDFALRQEMLLTILRMFGNTEDTRNDILENLDALKDEHREDQPFENDLLNQAERMKKNGRFNDALELIEDVLIETPGQPDAKQLKIEILGKKRRFVEASELKHQVDKPESKTEDESVSASNDSEVSLIIPTTGYGKPVLENCLLSVSEHCDTSKIELIVVDNASLDDTHDYLDELKERGFLNCKVITNKNNRGFAASVNKGISAATGEYICILHNDVEMTSDAIGMLQEMLETHPDFALAGPVTDKTLNPEQSARNATGSELGLIPAQYLDSFMMMMRAGANLKMDEKYELAFFEDIDLCFQAADGGHKIGISPKVEVKHHLGTTTFSFDLDTQSEQYWKNVAYFNEKWNIKVFSGQELNSMSTFDQLLALDELVNPMFPEEEIKKHYQQLLTDELKTEILKTEHDPEVLCRLVHIFMVMDEREVMRRLEDRLTNIELPASLIYQLVKFYYERNIYSRCTHYLNQLDPQNDTLRADLYRLSILTENKELEQAIPLLKDLLEQTPANPVLYKLAGDIHKFSGNDEEAHSFYNLAEQIDPFNFENEEKDVFGFEL